MHTAQIIWLFSLPVLIFITYRIILIVLRIYEKKFPPDVDIKSGENS
jgi:hypothetical protein